MTRFTVYIDESGDAGLAKIRSGDSHGASPFFVLGATVVQHETKPRAYAKLEEIRGEIGKRKWKHATDLDHPRKVYFARQLASLNVRLFSVVSNKVTLGDYAEKIDRDPQKFYNKCVQYLLERVCLYLARFGVEEEALDVILEERNHDYDAMLRFLGKVRAKPIYPESRSLKILNPFAVTTRAKGEDDLLEFADFTAHAVYQCVNKTKGNFNIPERRYFEEISRRFAGGEDGDILKYGLKCIHSLDALQLDPDIRELLRTARADLPSANTLGQ